MHNYSKIFQKCWVVASLVKFTICITSSNKFGHITLETSHLFLQINTSFVIHMDFFKLSCNSLRTLCWMNRIFNYHCHKEELFPENFASSYYVSNIGYDITCFVKVVTNRWKNKNTWKRKYGRTLLDLTYTERERTLFHYTWRGN